MSASNNATENTTEKETSTTTTQNLPNAIEFEPPLACVRRILKNTLPASTHVGKDASAAFARACGIFIIYISACANDFARENRRQTITANDVLAAVKELDFEEFAQPLMDFLDVYRASEKSKKDAKAKAAAEAKASAEDDAPVDEDDNIEGEDKSSPSSATDGKDAGDATPKDANTKQAEDDDESTEDEQDPQLHSDDEEDGSRSPNGERKRKRAEGDEEEADDQDEE